MTGLPALTMYVEPIAPLKIVHINGNNSIQTKAVQHFL